MSEPARQASITESAFDETQGKAGHSPHYDIIRRWLAEFSADMLALKRREAELLFRRIGITFAV
jgi:uncharacterized circularly permuted ATP-grasp superfamily protein